MLKKKFLTCFPHDLFILKKLIKGHNDSVSKVQWSPFNCNYFASSSDDRKINIYDIK